MLVLKQEVNQPKEKSPAHINGVPCVRSFKMAITAGPSVLTTSMEGLAEAAEDAEISSWNSFTKIFRGPGFN